MSFIVQELRAEIARSHTTLASFCRQTGMSPSSIYRKINKQTTPLHLNEAQRIEYAIGIPLSTLIESEETKEKQTQQ